MFLTFALGLAWMQLEFFRAAHMVLCVLCVVPAELVTHFALAEAKHCPPSPAPHTVPYPGKCAGVARGLGGQDSQSNGPKTYPIPHKVTFCGKLEQGEFSQGSSAQRMAGHQSAEWQVVSDWLSLHHLYCCLIDVVGVVVFLLFGGFLLFVLEFLFAWESFFGCLFFLSSIHSLNSLYLDSQTGGWVITQEKEAYLPERATHHNILLSLLPNVPITYANVK